MAKKYFALLIMICMTFSSVQGIDKTPYKFFAFGNIFYGQMRYTNRQLTERFDMILNGAQDFRKALKDSAFAYGNEIWVGPYASSQEINLYESGHPEYSYAQRLADTAKHWQYVYAKHYLDSIGMSPESLIVHLDDSYISIDQDGGEIRSYDLSSLPIHQKRFSYQYWNNNSGDYFYPAGYLWLANGYCPEARDAFAYAYYRHFVEDVGKFDQPNYRWDGFYMDNQQRDRQMPRLNSYYDVLSTSGGPTSQMDWIEQEGMETIENNTLYFDNSTIPIDSAIWSRLKAYNVRPFANTNKFDINHIAPLFGHVAGVTLESPIDYAKYWGNWTRWYEIADTFANHPETYIVWETRGDILCSSSPSAWNYDSSRIYMANYSFFLTVQDTNAFFNPHRWNDSTRWRSIYEVDFGLPDSSHQLLSTTESGSTKMGVFYRSYGTNAVLFRTAHGSADYTGDSVAVNLHNSFFEVNANGDTANTADSIFYLFPYSGKILVAADLGPCDYPPTTPLASSPANGSSQGLTPTLCVTNSSHGSCTDPVTYQFEIALDPGFSNLARQSGPISEGSGTSCYTTSTPLSNGNVYYWRARAFNGTSYSGWSATRNFTTPNSPPTAPTGLVPADLDTVGSLTPILTVSNGTDPDGGTLVYYFEVSKFEDFSTVAAQSPPVNSGSGTTTWQVTNILENGSDYFWRTRAHDGIDYGPWMDSLRFSINFQASNNAPTQPTRFSPPNEATLISLPITLSWYNSIDADGDVLTYQAELLDSAASTVLETVSAIVQGNGATTSFSPSIQITNNQWYSWRARAFDGTEFSTWMAISRFYLDTLIDINQRPDPPELIAPLNADTLISLQISLLINKSYDADGDDLTYDFAVYSDASLTNLVDMAQSVSPGMQGNSLTWPIPSTLTSGVQYFWSSRSHDGQEYSDWAEYFTFWAFDFSVDAGQASPTSLYPLPGEVINQSQPSLAVSNVADFGIDNLYYFELSRDSGFVDRVSSGPVNEDQSGTTIWEVTTPLANRVEYFWRTRANNSPYSETSTFSIDANIFIAPNPYRPSIHGGLTVFNMKVEGTLTITTVTNEIVRVLNGNASGRVIWDGKNDNGEKLASDIYLCYYKGDGQTDKFKFVVIR